MADLMHRAGYRFAIAHCNFHLRPADCDRDHWLTADEALSYGLISKIVTKRGDLNA